MMDSPNGEGENVRTYAGIRNGAGKSRAAAAESQYLPAENRILRLHLPLRLRLSDPERETLVEIGKRLGRALAQVAA